MTVAPASQATALAAKPHEVWFLTGSQGLYGKDVISQVEQGAAAAS